jgi:hypothetical protein
MHLGPQGLSEPGAQVEGPECQVHRGHMKGARLTGWGGWRWGELGVRWGAAQLSPGRRVGTLTWDLNNHPPRADRVEAAAGTGVGDGCDTEHARPALADPGGVPGARRLLHKVI